jgi:hypothetical protein
MGDDIRWGKERLAKKRTALFLRKKKKTQREKKEPMGFHADAALHRANGRAAHAARHDAAALETMPSHLLLRILELTDYDMNLFAASLTIRVDPIPSQKGQVPMPTFASHPDAADAACAGRSY